MSTSRSHRRHTRPEDAKFHALAAGYVFALRNAARLSQAELARRLGYHRQVIDAWEREQGAPSLAQVMRVAEACGLRLRLVPERLPWQGRPSWPFTDDGKPF